MTTSLTDSTRIMQQEITNLEEVFSYFSSTAYSKNFRYFYSDTHDYTDCMYKKY